MLKKAFIVASLLFIVGLDAYLVYTLIHSNSQPVKKEVITIEEKSIPAQSRPEKVIKPEKNSEKEQIKKIKKTEVKKHKTEKKRMKKVENKREKEKEIDQLIEKIVEEAKMEYHFKEKKKEKKDIIEKLFHFGD